MKKILSVCAVFLLLLPLLLQAGPGTASIDVLKVPTGIKAQAMGGAYIGLAEGLDAMDINPAGISFISKNEILFVHDVYFQDTFFDSIYYGRGMGESGSFAVSLKYLNTGTITSTLEDAQGNYAGEGEEKSGFNYMLGAGYGVDFGKLLFNEFTKNLKAGISLKLSGESLSSDYANLAISADVGGIYTIVHEEADFMSNRGETIWNKTGVGLVFRNLGTSFSSGITPMSFAAGIYTQFLNLFIQNNNVRFGADADYNLGNGINLRAGLEYGQRIENYVLTGRFGTNFNPEERSFSGFATGLGAGLDINGTVYEFNYAFLPYGELGNNHKFGLYIKF